MKLYGYWRSSASYRVRIALHHKSIPFEYVPINLIQNGGEQHGEEYRAKNPMEQVPILEFEDNGVLRRLGQSIAIIEWLEESFPAAPLLPTDRYLRARARQLAETINSGIQPFQNLTMRAIVKNELRGDDVAVARRFIEKGLRAYEILATDVAGAFSVGDAPSMADACLVPQLYSARSLGIDVTAYPLLSTIEQQCNELPGFQAAHPEKQVDAQRTA
ncbi:MAG: maleylacetoacetate isomerase [Polyangiaceae bacterium]|nr:maleylacetoacetate isomerase [Polyangiaceae bacterium]